MVGRGDTKALCCLQPKPHTTGTGQAKYPATWMSRCAFSQLLPSTGSTLQRMTTRSLRDGDLEAKRRRGPRMARSARRKEQSTSVEAFLLLRCLYGISSGGTVK